MWWVILTYFAYWGYDDEALPSLYAQHIVTKHDRMSYVIQYPAMGREHPLAGALWVSSCGNVRTFAAQEDGDTREIGEMKWKKFGYHPGLVLQLEYNTLQG